MTAIIFPFTWIKTKPDMKQTQLTKNRAMKNKVIEIMKEELSTMQLVDDSDPIAIVGIERAASRIDAEYTGVSDEKVLKIVDACFHMYASYYREDAKKHAIYILKELNKE